MTEAAEKKRVVFTPPGPDSPGYLKRVKKALKYVPMLQGMGDGQMDMDVIDELINFLAEWVVEPSDPDEAREALWDATQDEIFMLLRSVAPEAAGEGGKDGAGPLANPNGASSDSTSRASPPESPTGP